MKSDKITRSTPSSSCLTFSHINLEILYYKYVVIYFISENSVLLVTEDVISVEISKHNCFWSSIHKLKSSPLIWHLLADRWFTPPGAYVRLPCYSLIKIKDLKTNQPVISLPLSLSLSACMLGDHQQCGLNIINIIHQNTYLDGELCWWVALSRLEPLNYLVVLLGHCPLS